MNAVKAIYHNGMVELVEKPETQETAEVLVVFPGKQKKIAKIGGLFKGHTIDYDSAEADLKQLNKSSIIHLQSETAN
ncbi:MAG: hypothetical protein EPN22_15770 [Nitrospirae bacterium]|nr:MAG: hypothetical protein EPN22_15770 [Nitrospirota bacterium]